MGDNFFKLVSFLVKRCFKHLKISQKNNLADLQTAFLCNTSFALWDIASSLSGIKDLKSKLHWEKYTGKIPQNERFEKGIIICSLGYTVQTALGNQMYMSDFEPKRTSVFNKFRQSICCGTEELEKIILNFLNIIATYIAWVKPCF